MTFRGASAEAFEAASRELGTVVSGATDSAKVGDDLFSVVAILRSEPGLRRVVTDVSLPAQAKSGLVREILGGKVHDGALSVVVTAVERRWTAARDLADALEQLGVVAVVRSADDAERLADELFTFDRLVTELPELRDALSDPARSTEDKRTLVRSLLDLVEVAQDDDTDLAGVEVQGEALRAVLELEQLVGHRGGESADPGDAVSGLGNGADLFTARRVGLVVRHETLQGVADLVRTDRKLRHHSSFC